MNQFKQSSSMGSETSKPKRRLANFQLIRLLGEIDSIYIAADGCVSISVDGREVGLFHPDRANRLDRQQIADKMSPYFNTEKP